MEVGSVENHHFFLAALEDSAILRRDDLKKMPYYKA